jgi:hypothetical protein
MEQRVVIHENQQITAVDLNNVGEFPRKSLDHVVNDAVDNTRKFTGFPVIASGPLQVSVGGGRFYNQGKVFFRDEEGGVSLSLADYVPLVTKRIVTVAIWGQEVMTAVQPRTFLTDADTSTTEAEAVATESRRHAEANLAGGTEAVEPQPPALDANVLAVAYITMTPGGIESIVAVEDNRLASVKDNRTRIKALEVWRNYAGARLDTLASDLAGLAARTRGMVSRTDFNEVAADVARLKDIADLPVDLSSYGADHFLDMRDSDDTHPDWLCRVEEGIRFPAAQQHLAQIAILNQFDANVKIVDGFMLPKYTEVARIAVVGNDSEFSLSQYSYQTVQIDELTRTRTRTRYGQTYLYCTNAAFWKSGDYNQAQEIFSRGGENYEVIEWIAGIYGPRSFARIRQFWVDTWEESYTEARTITHSVSGSISGQTFLNAQDGWLTRIRLPFTKAAGTGDVHVLVTETTAGAPDLSRVIARVTVAAEDLKVLPLKTSVPIGPVHLTAGRYGIVWVTAGNHFMALVHDNKYLEGSFFQCTDGAWFQGDLTRDVPLELLFAEFASPRVEVQMQPITLENGIANIDILAESIAPAGTEIHYEVQINSVWRRLGHEVGLLNGLPALLPFRIVFLGTTDIHAGIALGAPSTVTSWRPRTDFQHVTKTISLTELCDEIEVRVQVEWWDNARHNVDCNLLTGVGFAAVVANTSVEERLLPDLSNAQDRREYRFRFSLGTPIDEFKIHIEGETNNALVTFHVSERVYIAWPA